MSKKRFFQSNILSELELESPLRIISYLSHALFSSNANVKEIAERAGCTRSDVGKETVCVGVARFQPLAESIAPGAPATGEVYNAIEC